MDTHFSRYAVAAGDRRWTRLARPPSSVSAAPRGKPFGTIRLAAGPALMLRLRAGFGVGSKADVLAFLLAAGGRPQSVKQIGALTLAGLEAEVAGGRTRPADEVVPLLERFREWVRESL